MAFKRKKYFYATRFPPEVFERALSTFASAAKIEEKIRTVLAFDAAPDDEVTIKNADRRYRELGFNSDRFSLDYYTGDFTRMLTFWRTLNGDSVQVSDVDELHEADSIIRLFEDVSEKFKEPVTKSLAKVTVFIGHGRSRLWRDLKDHLQDHHSIKVSAFETGPRAGFTIKEVLETCSSAASMAFLVHTGEDADSDGALHARENVIHETGLFQGKLGFRRSIVLLEDGCNEFSNIAGLQQIRFSKGNIKEIFGDVVAVLGREFATR